MNEGRLKGLWNRMLQEAARVVPGARSIRVHLHRLRGVTIERNVWIGYDCVLETSRPDLISIGANSVISIRVTLIAHFRGLEGIKIENDVFIGPGVIILPNVNIGRGSVIAAGSVVSASIPPMALAQGNPARPIATCGATLTGDASLETFYRSLRSIKNKNR